MAYPTMAVANAFIKRAKEGRFTDLTPMKLQKLMFFAQSWHLKWAAGKPLIDDSFSRWQYGPVIPWLYHEFKHYRASPIDQYGASPSADGDGALVHPIIPDHDQYSWKVIDEVIRAYGHLTGAQLSWLTHQKGSAWSESGEPDGGPIPNNIMMDRIGNG